VPSLRGKLKAKNEAIPVWDKNYLNLDQSQIGLEGSYTQVIKIFMPEHHYEVKMLEGSPDQQVDELYGKLKELNIV
jgi:electron transfer flavoprotein beta subunit